MSKKESFNNPVQKKLSVFQ